MTTTTATHAGFIADIVEHPEDDSIRLIFADWLEDHGDPERAEFIRVQVELANAPEKCLKPLRDGEPPFFGCDICLRVRELREIEQHLFDRHKCKWFGDGTAIHYLEHEREDSEGQYEDCLKSIVRRGFIAEVHAPLAVLEKHLPALVRQHPIERVRATDKEPTCCTPSSRVHHRRWYRDDEHDPRREQDDVPFALWEYMPKDMDGDGPSDITVLYYPAADAAHAALSEVLLRLARGMV